MVQNAATSSRNVSYQLQKVLSRLLSHFLPSRSVAVATLVHSIPNIPRGLRTSASASVKSSLSLPSRVALSRPFGAPFMPRGPSVANRSVAQVGLGTARNFSNGRPIFQNLVQNVPVSGRAFYEADIDFRLKNNVRIRPPANKENKKTARKEMAKPTMSMAFPSVVSTVTEPEVETEFTTYFAEASSAPFITTLSIPLAPTGTRAPLEPSIDNNAYSQVLSIHDSYTQHLIRITSLLRRLDRANVWSGAVTVDCLDTEGDGLCRMLNVRMDGWTEEMLKKVIGEAGTGWCRIKSVPKVSVGSTSRPLDPSPPPPSTVDQTDFIMPTLDFSSAFYTSSLPNCSQSHDDAESSAPSIFGEAGEASEDSIEYLTSESDWGTMEESASGAGFLSGLPSEAASDVGDVLDNVWDVDSPGLESRISLSSSFNSRFM